MVDMIPNCSDTTGAEWRDNICLIRINNDGNECGLWLIRAICHKTQNIWSAAAWIRKGFKWCHVFNTFYLCIKCISKRTFDHNNLKVHFMKMQNCRFMFQIQSYFLLWNGYLFKQFFCAENLHYSQMFTNLWDLLS